MQTVKVRIPKYHLGDVPIEKLPSYLSPVRAAADMLYGMALHPCGKEGRDVVLSMIDQAIAELAEAREAISKLDTIVPVEDETIEEIKAGATQLVLDVSRFDLESGAAASGEEKGQAKKDVKEALAALEEKPVIDPGCVDGSGYIDYPEPDQTYGAADD